MQAFDDLFKVWHDYKDWLRKAIWDLGLTTEEDVREFTRNHSFLDWFLGLDWLLDEDDRAFLSVSQYSCGMTPGSG